MILNAQEMIAELDWGKLTDQLKFFDGDGSKKDLPLQKMQNNIGDLSKASLEFLDFLSSDYCKEFLQKNKWKIHVKNGEIFHNVNTGENLYNVFSDQEDETKKLNDLHLNLSRG